MDISRYAGNDVYGTDGKIGTVGQVYLDNETNQPEWVTVKSGFLTKTEVFVPLKDSQVITDYIQVPYTKEKVKGAPQIDPDRNLSPDEEDELYRYYGLSSSDGRLSDQFDNDDNRPVGRDVSGPTTDDAMTRSEERLNVGKQRQQVGKARLRKFVTTEQQTVTVPVQREEVRLEREPITDSNVGAALDGPEISEEEHEVTLHEERAVVDTEVVPVERVKLNKETVTEQETVGGEIRKEQIELNEDDQRDRF